MRNLILAIYLISVSTIQLAAQNVPATGTSSQANETRRLNPGDLAKQDANKAAEQLALTSEQKAKWEIADLERITANKAVRDKMNTSTTPQQRKDLRIQMKTNNDTFKTAVYAFLTPEQKTKYDQIQKEKHDARKSRMRGRKGQAQQNGNNSTQ